MGYGQSAYHRVLSSRFYSSSFTIRDGKVLLRIVNFSWNSWKILEDSHSYLSFPLIVTLHLSYGELFHEIVKVQSRFKTSR